MAAQQHVETMKNVGESEPMPQMSVWLKQNRLSKKLGPYFEDNEVEVEDLLTYSEKFMELMIY